MKSIFRAGMLAGALIIGLPALPGVDAQVVAPKVAQIFIEHIGPHAASDSLILANIRTKSGETFSQASVDEDIKNLYATGFFSNIRVSEKATADGVQLTYVVEGKAILTDLKIVGNKRYSTKKLLKKVTSKVGQPLDERKLFTDAQEVQKYYQNNGYQKTVVKALPPAIDESTGRGTATIEVEEAPKVKIKDIVFDNVGPFPNTNEVMVTNPQKALRKVLKTKRRWMFSFITGSGILKEDEFEDDKDRLAEYFQNEGYIDYTLKDVRFDNISPTRMVIHFDISMGRQYRVGTLDFHGNSVYSTNDFLKGLVLDERLFQVQMVPGKVFTPVGLMSDSDAMKDIYGAKGYIDAKITANKNPNPTTGTMDLAYDIEEGEKSFVEKIEIKGNYKTRDKVLRRELAVYPGETYDMVRVKLSKERLQGLDYFEKIDTQPEETDVPNRKNLVIGVEEKNTGNLILGAGFSSVDSVLGFVEVSQGNFDLFNPPTFTGGGQKLRLRAQVGTVRQDYEISFVEPWFLGRKLMLGVDLFYRDLGFVSLNDIYDEVDAGGTVSLTRALGSDFLIGRVAYTLEDVDIKINSGFHTNTVLTGWTPQPNTLFGKPVYEPPNVSQEIFNERGQRLVSKIGTSLAYDTSNHALLPDRGQRTELFTELAGLGGDTDFYKLELRTHWYFKGFAKDHIFEVAGGTGVVDSYGSSSRVPIFDRWFLGGMYSLRGFRYHEVGPKDVFGEPIGGGTYWFGTAEYSVPVIERVRFAMFYDIGNVFRNAYSFDPGQTGLGQNRPAYNDDFGFGLRINLPMLGPLRLDYGIPITHDPRANSSGRFQFGVGFTRPF